MLTDRPEKLSEGKGNHQGEVLFDEGSAFSGSPVTKRGE